MTKKEMTALLMIDPDSWRNVAKGYYRFVYAPGACYEILVNFSTDCEINDLNNATATLYSTGTWRDKDGKTVFERESIFAGTITECMFAAKKDYEENVTEE